MHLFVLRAFVERLRLRVGLRTTVRTCRLRIVALYRTYDCRAVRCVYVARVYAFVVRRTGGYLLPTLITRVCCTIYTVVGRDTLILITFTFTLSVYVTAFIRLRAFVGFPRWLCAPHARLRLRLRYSWLFNVCTRCCICCVYGWAERCCPRLRVTFARTLRYDFAVTLGYGYGYILITLDVAAPHVDLDLLPRCTLHFTFTTRYCCVARCAGCCLLIYVTRCWTFALFPVDYVVILIVVCCRTHVCVAVTLPAFDVTRFALLIVAHVTFRFDYTVVARYTPVAGYLCGYTVGAITHSCVFVCTRTRGYRLFVVDCCWLLRCARFTPFAFITLRSWFYTLDWLHSWLLITFVAVWTRTFGFYPFVHVRAHGYAQLRYLRLVVALHELRCVYSYSYTRFDTHVVVRIAQLRCCVCYALFVVTFVYVYPLRCCLVVILLRCCCLICC